MPSIREKYKEEIDFSVLALQSSAFAKLVKPNGQLNFSDPKAVQELTKSLLKRDFGLNIDLPDDRLCPPVPNRLNYVFWLQDLLDTSSDSHTEVYEPERKVIGLDIGTGASCIYPLLGCSLRPRWMFAGTDIDDKSLEYAHRNVTSNSLQSRIKLLRTTTDGPLIPLDTLGLDSIDFVMCNPPFYASLDELLTLAAQKSRPPLSACNGSPSEMITPGGELAFSARLLSESLNLRTRVQWYTTMLGKLSSVTSFIPKLKEAGITNWAVTEFVQGGKTRRWGAGWSLGGRRPAMATGRGVASLPKGLLPFPVDYLFNVPLQAYGGTSGLGKRLHGLLEALDGMRWKWKEQIETGVGFTRGNVWSRASRRKEKRAAADVDEEMKDDDDEESDDEDGEEEYALGFKVQLTATTGDQLEVKIRWLVGQEHVLFESFCGMLKRRLSSG